MSGLGGKTVVVTGAGTGIGAAVAKQVVDSGGNVVLVGRRQALIEAVASDLNEPERVQSCPADAASLADMDRLVEQALARFGAIDAVVACAGTVEVGGVIGLSEEAWRRDLHSNLDTAYITAKATLPSIIARKGAFTVVSSIAGVQAMPQAAAYVTAKHAVIGLVRSIAVDYGPVGVRANVVCPGWVRTPMADMEMQALMERDRLSLDGAYALVTSDTPLRRPATPEEVAALCCFLSSDAAGAISGGVFNIDGGSTAVSVPTLRM